MYIYIYIYIYIYCMVWCQADREACEVEAERRKLDARLAELQACLPRLLVYAAYL